MGLFSKVRTIALGNAHDILDRVIDANSPSALRQYVRDLETAIAELQTEAASQDAYLRTMTREESDLDSKIALAKSTVAQLLKSTDPSAPGLARNKAQVIVTDQKTLDGMVASMANQKKTVESTNSALAQLKTKHDVVVSRVHELERLDRITKAKEHTAAAIKNAGSILGSVDSAGIDDVQQKMLRRNDMANSKFDAAMGSIATAPEENSEDVDALLASLK